MQGGWVVQIFVALWLLESQAGATTRTKRHCAKDASLLDPKGQRRNPMSAQQAGTQPEVVAGTQPEGGQAQQPEVVAGISRIVPDNTGVVTSQFMQALLHKQTKCIAC